MRRILIVIAIALVSVLIITGCATSSRTVQRTAADTQIDLSGRWNDTDSRLVSEEMVQDLMNRPWLNNFRSAEGRAPVLMVGAIRNRSSEHIDTNTFIKDIERELVNSGMVKFVAASDQREQIREERLDQQTQASRETIKRLGEETGADFMLQGNISSTTDAVEGRRVVAYQVSMELVNIETNEKVWIGSKEIKKYIEQKKTKW
ncbi:MAG: penicillin-binding protein activator LpoB [Spirochaetaceae bacterium]